MSLSFLNGSTSMYFNVPRMLTTTAVVKNWQAVTRPGYGKLRSAHLFTILSVEEHTAYIEAIIKTYAGEGVEAGIFASCGTRLSPASSAAAAASFLPRCSSVWRRRRMVAASCLVPLIVASCLLQGVSLLPGGGRYCG